MHEVLNIKITIHSFTVYFYSENIIWKFPEAVAFTFDFNAMNVDLTCLGFNEKKVRVSNQPTIRETPPLSM